MIGCAHDVPLCALCLDVGAVPDPRSADEDGVQDMLPCPSCAPDQAERHEVQRVRRLGAPPPYPLTEDDITW